MTAASGRTTNTLRPDIVLLATEWRPRVLLRAQLIEQGFDVIATDSWTVARSWLCPDSTSPLAIIDLQGLLDPDRVLNDATLLMRPDRVLVLGAMGTLILERIQALGVRVVNRPTPISNVIAAAARAIRDATSAAHEPRT